MILPKDIAKCTGKTEDDTNCAMKQNCKRYLSLQIDAPTYKEYETYSVINAPDCIKHDPLNCPLKIMAYNENE